MARVKVLLLLCFYEVFNSALQAELMCEVANVKVESEDGRTQMFEMKKLEPTKGEACTLCAHPAVNLAPQISTLKSQLILSVADKELSSECDPNRSDLPLGLCTFNSDSGMCIQNDPESCSSASEELVEEIIYKNMVPYATGDENIDRVLALALVMQNAGNLDGAINQYTSIIKDRPNTLEAYYGRGVAYSRKGLKVSRNAELALSDFDEVIERDKKFVEGYERRVEAYIAMGQYNEAIEDLGRVIELKPNGKALFARGVMHLLLEKHQSNQNGFVVSTQVPSMRKRADKDRLEGAMLVLTEDLAKQILFTIDIANTRTRTSEYTAELDYIYNQLQDEIRRAGSSKVAEMDSVVNIILSMAYYFYNWMPLSRGSSVVAYSVALGLIMSVGRQVTGKLPTGKLLEMEAMLSGAPDAFLLVTKQWMAIKRLNSPMSGLPKVWETFPSVRSVLEVLNVNTDSC